MTVTESKQLEPWRRRLYLPHTEYQTLLDTLVFLRRSSRTGACEADRPVNLLCLGTALERGSPIYN